MSKTSSEEMVDLIKQLIADQISQLDQLVVCKIFDCNSDGTYNVKVVPIDDGQPMIKNVKANSFMDLKTDDYVYAMSIKNQLNNLVIFAKIGVEMPKSFVDQGEVRNLIAQALQQYIPTLPDGMAASRNYVDQSISDAVQDTIKVYLKYDLYTDAGPYTFSDVLKELPLAFIYIRNEGPISVPSTAAYLCSVTTRRTYGLHPSSTYIFTAFPINFDGSTYVYRVSSSDLSSEYFEDLFAYEHENTIVPSAPTVAGTYGLRVVENDGELSYSWVDIS